MSIKSELNKTAEYLRRTRKAILGRGGEISETAGLKDLPDAIINIPADTSLAFQTDEETAYEKVVPSGAEEYALLKSVGGMSYKTRNLIPYPYVNTTRTISGITFTDVGNGEIVLSGTWSGGTEFADFVLIKGCNLPVGNYTLSGAEGGATYSYRVFGWIKNGDGTTKKYISVYTEPAPFEITNGDSIEIYVRVSYDIGTVSNLVISPMLNEGTTALPYEPYFEGLRHTKVTALESEGANLVKMVNGTHVLNDYYTAQLNNGHIRVDRKGDASNQQLSSTLLRQYTSVFLTAGTYTLMFQNIVKENMSGTGLYIVKSNGEMIVSGVGIINGKARIILDTDDTITWGIYMYETTNYTEDGYFEADVMLNAGTDSAPYKPYVGKIYTYPIPEAVQSLEGYGEGNPDNPEEYNYTDLINKKQVNAGKITDDTWVKFDTPIETDISDLLPKDNFIKVEGGGVIRAVNEHKQDAPSTIKYTVKVGN